MFRLWVSDWCMEALQSWILVQFVAHTRLDSHKTMQPLESLFGLFCMVMGMARV